jgi:hypothetical protein
LGCSQLDLLCWRRISRNEIECARQAQKTEVDSGLSFWEVKNKIDAHTTLKSRMRAQALSTEIAQEAEPFLRTHCPCQTEALEPQVSNSFQRITLVSTRREERLTVDVRLRFGCEGAHASLPGIAIAEVKQDGFSLDSAFIQQMRALGIRPTGFSKYCIAVSMLQPTVKHNRFKPQLCQIARLLQENRRNPVLRGHGKRGHHDQQRQRPPHL